MQNSQVDCRPLADWLGQGVRFQGYLNYWETASKTGDTALLLQRVKVVPYRGCREQIRTLDHIWLYIDKNVPADDKFERYGGYAAVGKVVSYTRSNGTKDFAINIKPYVSIKTHLELLKECGEPNLEDIKTKTRLLEITLNLLDIGELDFSVYFSYEQVYRRFRDEYEFCKKQVEINERYEEKKQHRSRPNPDILKFTSASSQSVRAVSKGFANSRSVG